MYRVNHVVAKIRMKSAGNKYRKVISDITPYQLPEEITDFIPYSPDYCLCEDEWFGVPGFSKESYCLPMLLEDFSSTELEKLKGEEFDKLDYLCSYQNCSQYFFQKITRTHLFSKKSISIGDVVEYRENSREIIIKEVADAVYLKDKDTLYFKNLSAISGIFKGIDSLYRVATEEETSEFLKNEFIQLEGGFSEEKIKTANRKRIAMAIDTVKNCGEKKKKIIFDSIREYCPDLMTDRGKFKIDSEKSLKLLLYGIDQRFYTTPDGEEKRIANSIIRLPG